MRLMDNPGFKKNPTEGKKPFPSYKGLKVLVLGLARSGLAAARLLREEGAEVVGADENVSIGLPADLEGIPITLGPLSSGLLEGCDEVILSPGVPAGHSLLREAESRGIPVSSELELGSRFALAEMIAVTGTNGKSTTVSMIGEILEEEGMEAVVAGNVGLPFCSVVRNMGPGGVFVLEVSSFQLESISGFHPRVAGILNLTPDHMDRYTSVGEYYGTKTRIVENCEAKDAFFFNALDRRCAAVAEGFVGLRVPFSSSGTVDGVYVKGETIVRVRGDREEEVLELRELGAVGFQNVENALAAIAALEVFDVAAESCRRALMRFRGLPHRMEEVARIGGVVYYNDSKATNVEATMASLRGLGARVVLIAGGRDKGGDFKKLIPFLGRVKAVITIGEAAPLVEGAIGSAVPTARSSTMREAVIKASRKAEAGEIVLLSPACASFDMFEDFEHRGRVFRECVSDMEKARR